MEAPAQSAGDDFDGDFGGEFEGSDDGGSNGGPVAPGMGQSKSSRRRRRKRKNKAAAGPTEGAPTPAGSEDAAGQGQAFSGPVVMEGESLALATPAAPFQQRRAQGQAGQNGQAQQQGQPQGQGTGKRWKKKFRDRDRRQPRSENPGNDFRVDSSSNSNGGGFSSGYRQDGRPDNFGNLNGNFKRKNKGSQQQGGRKERGFVGPMDHSYREVNGNFADGPPATIQVHNGGRRSGHRHHGDSQPIDHSMPRAIPIPENAQIHIYFFIEDLFLTAKIQETARKQGIKVAFVKNEKDAIAELTSGEDTNRPALIVFDLNNANAKPLTLIPKLRTKLKRSVSIIGFLSSIQGDLKAKAVEVGCDTVMPRAAFSQNLPNLLRRYGVEEVDEVNYNY
jgi:hypothetical protein